MVLFCCYVHTSLILYIQLSLLQALGHCPPVRERSYPREAEREKEEWKKEREREKERKNESTEGRFAGPCPLPVYQ